MALYRAEVSWERGESSFTRTRYSRKHHWKFDGGVEVVASSSPHVVPLPLSEPCAVDPEEALVAALSSCHMLMFLAIAADNGFRVDSYRDQATGALEKNAEGKLWLSRITLYPDARFSGEKLPEPEDIERMHEEAHAECYIANSVKTDIHWEPVYG